MEIPLIVGGGLIVIGVGIGIGQIGKGAMEAMDVNQMLVEKFQLMHLFYLLW